MRTQRRNPVSVLRAVRRALVRLGRRRDRRPNRQATYDALRAWWQ